MERKAREEDNFSFSYNLARPPSLRMDPHPTDRLKWILFEKGFEKLHPSQRYELSYDTIKSALLQIREHIPRSPCKKSQILRDKGFQIYLKIEIHRKTNSVKDRGIVYTLLQLSEKQKRNGVIAISMGYFAWSLCFYAKRLSQMLNNDKEEEEEQDKIPVTMVMPTSGHKNFKRICENLGATVICHESISYMVQAHKEALRIAKKEGLVYIDSNDHPNMIIGQATLGIEMLKDMPYVDAIILPTAVDGCGLTVGLAMAIKETDPTIKVIEVRFIYIDPLTENIRDQSYSFDELDIPVTRHVWYNRGRYLPHCWIDTFVTVRNPSLILSAIELLQTKENVFDLGAAIGLAGILSGELDELKGKRVVIPLFGGLEWYMEQRIIDRNLEPRAGPSNA